MGASAHAPVYVDFKATGVENVRRGMQAVGGEADPTARKWGLASRQIAGGFESIARQGKVTGESIKQVVTQGAEMATMFSGAGPIVGAVALIGVAFVSAFQRARREMEETTRTALAELEKIVQAGDVKGLDARIAATRSGVPGAIRGSVKDETDAQFLARSQGSQGVNNRIRDIEANLGRFLVGGGATSAERGAEIVQLREERKQLLVERARLVKEATDAQRQRAAAVGIKAAADASEAAERAREKAAEEERKRREHQAQIRAEMEYGTGLVNRLAAGRPGLPGFGGVAQSRVFGSGGFGVEPGNWMAGASDQINKLPGLPRIDTSAQEAFVNHVKSVAEIAGEGFTSSFATAIGTGMQAAFAKGGNAGSIFAGFTSSFLAGLGSTAVQIGEKTLVFAKLFGSIEKWLYKHPLAAIPASLAMIAFGSTLQGAAGRISANSSGGGYGGGGYSGSGGSGMVIDRGYISPVPMAQAASRVSPSGAVTNHITIIGKNDPNAQRELVEMIRAAERRGL